MILVAPLDGWAGALDEVPDPVFAGKVMGDGLAIDPTGATPVSYTHLRAHETSAHLVCRLLLEKKVCL